jgi:hypothetical protein
MIRNAFLSTKMRYEICDIPSKRRVAQIANPGRSHMFVFKGSRPIFSWNY